MLLQEGLADFCELIGEYHVVACSLWDLGTNYEEKIFPWDLCSWAFWDITSPLPYPSKDLSEPAASTSTNFFRPYPIMLNNR